MKSVSQQKAASYHRHRLPYSQEAAAGILKYIKSDSPVILDIGAGTGLLAEIFLGMKYSAIYALEPEWSMLEIMHKEFYQSRSLMPIRALSQHLPIRSDSIDLILLGNSFHRLPPEVTKNEFRRVLKSSGRIAVVSYKFKSNPLNSDLAEVYKKLPNWSSRVQNGKYDVGIGFYIDHEVNVLEYPMIRHESRQDFVAATMASIEAPDEDDSEREPAETAFEEAFEKHGCAGVMTIEYSTVCHVGPIAAN